MTQLELAFNKFDMDNPNVWEMFLRFTDQLVSRGYKRLSASLVTERIRWETTIVTRGSAFKICNNHRAYYARKWNNAFQHGEARFITRQTNGQQIFDGI